MPLSKHPRTRAELETEEKRLCNHNCWLHTEARKYNLSALGTYFECEGIKRTNLNFS